MESMTINISVSFSIWCFIIASGLVVLLWSRVPPLVEFVIPVLVEVHEVIEFCIVVFIPGLVHEVVKFITAVEIATSFTWARRNFNNITFTGGGVEDDLLLTFSSCSTAVRVFFREGFECAASYDIVFSSNSEGVVGRSVWAAVFILVVFVVWADI